MTRIPELPEKLDARGQEVYDAIKSGPRGRVKGPLGLWLHSPELAARAQKMGEYLRFDSAFEPRLSELIILLVAEHYQCNYEWYVHAPIATEKGLDHEVVEAIRVGKKPTFKQTDEAAVYAYIRELLNKPRIEQSTFDAFYALFSNKGVVDAAAITGYYTLGAFTLNSVELNPEGELPFAP